MKILHISRFRAAGLICLLPFLCLAQEKEADTLSVSSKIDSIYLLQKKMYRETKNEPLSGKKFGLEFNFARLLMIEKAVSLSGSFSLFGVSRHSEVAFPWFYSNPEDQKDLNEWTIDCHYRDFLGNTQNGFYLSVFVRYAHLEGYLGNNWLIDTTEPDDVKDSENKVGIGVGLGYRKFSYKGLYWGASLSFGRYITGKHNKFYGNFLAIDDDQNFIIDVEFLKFGWAF